ncbi:MAG: hypothetical protein AVDCRST_MAG17-749 [uncultured Solirubrobacterales bacterium]|uniref:PAS domain-containing protein n=1 Tax=uncultured Solirubrobacterales bacterium TaxID=768556 RepID=A0A6J4SCG4_9ACTN|nr:MAG: hypothetical protein AVDCRST_MAG17-749 [uncultured Solirubrobacterales bacterium]
MNRQRLFDEAAERLSRLVGDLCVLAMVGDSPGRFEPVAVRHRSESTRRLVEGALAAADLDSAGRWPLARRAVESGEPVLVTRPPGGYSRLDPALRPYVVEHSVSSVLFVPVRARGLTIGVAALAREGAERSYTSDDHGVVKAVVIGGERRLSELRSGGAQPDRHTAVLVRRDGARIEVEVATEPLDDGGDRVVALAERSPSADGSSARSGSRPTSSIRSTPRSSAGIATGGRAREPGGRGTLRLLRPGGARSAVARSDLAPGGGRVRGRSASRGHRPGRVRGRDRPAPQGREHLHRLQPNRRGARTRGRARGLRRDRRRRHGAPARARGARAQPRALPSAVQGTPDPHLHGAERPRTSCSSTSTTPPTGSARAMSPACSEAARANWTGTTRAPREPRRHGVGEPGDRSSDAFDRPDEAFGHHLRARAARPRDGSRRTARRRTEARLRFQAELLDRVDAAVVAVDTEGIVTHWNRCAQQFYGFSAEEAVGASISDLTACSNVEDRESLLERIGSGDRPWEEGFKPRRTDGETIPVYARYAPVRGPGGRDDRVRRSLRRCLGARAGAGEAPSGRDPLPRPGRAAAGHNVRRRTRRGRLVLRLPADRVDARLHARGVAGRPGAVAPSPARRGPRPGARRDRARRGARRRDRDRGPHPRPRR